MEAGRVTDEPKQYGPHPWSAERLEAELIAEELRERAAAGRASNEVPSPSDGDAPPFTDEERPPPSEDDIDPDGEDFDRNDKGRIYHTQDNAALALRKLGIAVRYDTFADHELVDGLPGFGPELDDAAMIRIRMLIDSRFGFRLAKDLLYDFVSDQARYRAFHPVRDYLKALQWDGVLRVGSWLTRYGGAADTAYTRAVGRIVLVAAVRRVMQPGCKFDEMLILESAKQGKSKSTALSVLAGKTDWFTDELPLGDDTKRLIEATDGRWIVEAGELKGMSKGDVNALKGYLSRTVDSARMAYGRKRKVRARQFIIIGTTNETRDYLKDATGNRRFWPVQIVEFDLDLLRAERDQLWAEASHLEAAGASIRLDPSLYAVAGIEQEARRGEDAMEIAVGEAFGDLTGRVKISDAWAVLGITGRTLTQDEMTRFGAAMRKHGWERERVMEDGTRNYFYAKGTDVERSSTVRVDGRGPGSFAHIRSDARA
jgi:hypothetical protein